MHFACILVYILFLIKKKIFFFFWSDFLPPPGLVWVSGTEAPSACKTYKQPEELIASRKLVVDAAKWWMPTLQLEWDGVSFLVWRRGDPKSKLKWFAAMKMCLLPHSSECFLRFGVCSTLGHRWFGLIEGCALPKRKIRNSSMEIFGFFYKFIWNST